MEIDGHKVSGRQAIARMVWGLATTGTLIFPDGTTLNAGADAWLDTVKWLYQHIDGPPKAGLDVTSNGESLNARPALDHLTPDELAQLEGLLSKADSDVVH